jgi:hypothetical protein
MAKPNSRATLIDYCLRNLGAPVIEINVDDDQLDDRIDEALQFYQHYHADAIEKVFLKHKIDYTKFTMTYTGETQALTVGETITGDNGATAKILAKSDTNVIVIGSYNPSAGAFVNGTVITGGTSTNSATISIVHPGAIDYGYIPIPELVTDVIRVLPIRDHSSSTSLFDVKYQMHLNDMYSLGYMGSLLEYTMAKEYLATLDILIDSDDKFVSFDRHQDRLRIDMDWANEVSVGGYIVVEAYRIIDPATFTDVYNDYFLKKYATALVKKQWGANLIKFEGMTMPGGVTFNGRQLFDDAVEELQRLEEEVRLNWEQPVDFYIG